MRFDGQSDGQPGVTTAIAGRPRRHRILCCPSTERVYVVTGVTGRTSMKTTCAECPRPRTKTGGSSPTTKEHHGRLHKASDRPLPRRSISPTTARVMRTAKCSGNLARPDRGLEASSRRVLPCRGAREVTTPACGRSGAVRVPRPALLPTTTCSRAGATLSGNSALLRFALGQAS